jgi:hypothetical protein
MRLLFTDHMKRRLLVLAKERSSGRLTLLNGALWPGSLISALARTSYCTLKEVGASCLVTSR